MITDGGTPQRTQSQFRSPLRKELALRLEQYMRERFNVTMFAEEPRWGPSRHFFFCLTQEEGPLTLKVKENGSEAHNCERESVARVRSSHLSLQNAVPEILDCTSVDGVMNKTFSVLIERHIPGVSGAAISDPSERSEMWREAGKLVRRLHSSTPITTHTTESMKQALVQNFVLGHLKSEHRETLLRHRVFTDRLWQKWEERLEHFGKRRTMDSCFCHIDLNPTNLTFETISRQVHIHNWEWASESHLVGRYRDFVDIVISSKNVADHISFREGYGVNEREFLESGDKQDIDTFQITLYLPYALLQIQQEKWQELERTRQLIQGILRYEN